MEEFTFQRPQTQVAPEETPGFTFRRPSAQNSVVFKRPQEDSLMLFERKMQEYEGKDFNPEVIKQDPELMRLVRDNISTRFKDRNMIYGGATAVAGGATAFGWEDMSDDEIVDTFLNYHRSFAGGQTVTTANEVAYAATADEATRARLALGYKLFDRLDNSITGSGTWGNTFDAVGDYMTAAIWDPTTVIGLGVGRAFSAGGAKAASLALREGAKLAYKNSLEELLKQGVSRSIAQETASRAAESVMKKGFQAIGTQTVRESAEATVKSVVKKNNIALGMADDVAEAAALKAISSVGTRGTQEIAKQELLRFGVAQGAVDLTASVGADIAQQNVKLITGAQDEYSIPQTAVAALGVIVTPALLATAKAAGKGISKVTKEKLAPYRALQENFVGQDKAQIMDIIKGRADLDMLNGNLKASLKDFLDNLENGVDWVAAKARDKAALAADGKEPRVTPGLQDFLKRFMIGYVDTSGKVHNGLVYEMARAGIRYVPRDVEDKATHFVADAVEWLDPKYIQDAIDGYERVAGVKLNLKPDQLAAEYRSTMNLAATELRLGRTISDILRNADDMAKVESLVKASTKEGENPAWGAWVLSIWKRMVTSHPSTTGLNVKGWAGLSLMNSTSDLVQGVLEYGAGTYQKVMGNQAAAVELMRKGKGSLLGVARRGYNILEWDATIKEAEAFLQLNPQIREELFAQGTGEAGSPLARVEQFNVPSNTATKAAEGTVGIAQKFTGGILQDEVTKQLSFMSALDRQIMRTYGQTYEEFMSRPDVWMEMATPNFQTEVIARALDRTVRETASKSWNDKKGSNWSLWGAKIIEQASNNSTLGYAIPFGRFFNTATATLGDFSMINAVRHYALKKSDIDKAQDEGLELIAKGVTGWSTVVGFAIPAMDKIEEGLAWNQERREDGSIEDLTYDFPESFWRIGAQMVGHWMKDGEAPPNLFEELSQVYGAQTFRTTTEAVDTVFQILEDASSLKGTEVATGLKDVILNFTGGIISGITRPLDPLNSAAMVVSGDYTQPDRRQGNVFYNEATRYIDKIFNLPTEEQRFNSTRGGQERTDLGAVLGGVRSTGENPPIERMLNSIGMRPWQTIRWDGDPEVKNRMDQIAAPVFNTYAELALNRHPDFAELPLEKREHIYKTEVLEPAKEKVKEVMKLGGADDQILGLMSDISKEGEAKVNNVLKILGYGSLSDISKEEGAMEKLKMIQYYLKNYDELKF